MTIIDTCHKVVFPSAKVFSSFTHKLLLTLIWLCFINIFRNHHLEIFVVVGEVFLFSWRLIDVVVINLSIVLFWVVGLRLLLVLCFLNNQQVLCKFTLSKTYVVDLSFWIHFVYQSVIVFDYVRYFWKISIRFISSWFWMASWLHLLFTNQWFFK